MQPPSDPPPSATTRQRWVSFAEALRILGLSETTLRRMIRQGRVTAEAQPRAEGDSRVVYRVLVTDPPDDPPVETPPSADIRHDSESDQPPPTRHDPPDIATGLLERLADQDAAVAAKDAEIARINAENADLRERAGRAEAERDMLAEQLAREREEAERLRRPWWHWW